MLVKKGQKKKTRLRTQSTIALRDGQSETRATMVGERPSMKEFNFFLASDSRCRQITVRRELAAFCRVALFRSRLIVAESWRWEAKAESRLGFGAKKDSGLAARAVRSVRLATQSNN